MRIEQLGYLVAISKTKSISLAAKQLYISHQGMSNAISMMEKELGKTLLVRTNKGVELTEIGQKYADCTSSFLERLEALKTEENASLNLDGQLLTGALCIYTAPLLGVCILPKVISEYKKKYPLVRINIKQTDSQGILTAVKEGKADIGLITIVNKEYKKIKSNAKNNLIEIQKLFSDNLCVLTSKLSPLASNRSVTLKETLRYPLAVYYSMKDVITFLENNAYLYGTPDIAIESENDLINLGIIEEGSTIGLMSHYNWLNYTQKKVSDNIITLPLCDDISLLNCLVVNKNNSLSVCSQAFLDVLDDMKTCLFC
ncbi:LysR family transcriptional regulator [Dehalobacter sp. DCM]|uniref:LysR family transcriptional regulator n=1 Tax=Dehalobacter sp. DCM TaxID=2907827 RepID=UPI003081CDA8|nr:LysR family transcriptional regulator [Dehalobacter sp. DCM]